MATPGPAISFTVNEFKGLFFDSKAVTSRLDRGNRKALSKFGAFTRRRAKSSIRTRKNAVSKPGNPPYSKTGKLKKLTFFAYDPQAQSVVIGPARIPSPQQPNVPETLEYGGTQRLRLLRIVEGQIDGEKRDTRGRFLKKGSVKYRMSKSGKPVRVQYKARPWMGPAFEAEKAASLPDLWKDSVK